MRIRLFHIIFIILVSCTNNKASKIPIYSSDYTLEDIIGKEIEIFDLKSDLNQILDSIIQLSNECPDYINLPYDFVFECYQDTNDNHVIHISNWFESHRLNYNRCIGLFYYKGYQFSYIGDFVNEYFIPTDKKAKVFFLSPEKYDEIVSKYGEFFNSSWDFSLKNGNLYCYHYNYCGDFWYDSTYFKGVE